jgi:heat shock protein HslJ
MSRSPLAGALLAGLLVVAAPLALAASSPVPPSPPGPGPSVVPVTPPPPGASLEPEASPVPETSPGGPLEGIEWRLVQLAGSGVPFIDVPPGVEPTLRIDGTDAGGDGGCNRWFSTATIEGDAIAFGPIGSTMMACEEPRMSIELEYLAKLSQVARWAVSGTTLDLSDAGGAVLLRYTSGQDAGDIEGIEWRIRDVLMDAALAAIPEPVVATLLLDAGVASGSTGCNRYSGPYTLDGDALTIGALAVTEMACEEPAMQVESAVLVALGTVLAWRMEDEALQLLDATGSPVLVLVPAAPPAA